MRRRNTASAVHGFTDGGGHDQKARPQCFSGSGEPWWTSLF
jgi:hypothetical protein